MWAITIRSRRMTNLAVPMLGFGDERPPGVTVTWRDGTVVYRGILGSCLQPEPEPRDNVIYLCEWRHNNKWR